METSSRSSNRSFDQWTIDQLLEEFELVRRSHLAMFEKFSPDAWLRRGVVNDHPASARAFAYGIAGHAKHHLDIVTKRLARH